MKQRTVTIVGGGPAGLALAIALRERAVPVRVLEAGKYPRHRVCGECISGRGQEVLDELGVKGLLEQAGARPARTVAFFDRAGAVVRRVLPQPALCVSRFTLERVLAGELCRLGGQLQPGVRWREGFESEGVVRATGRRVQLRPQAGRWRWFGLKIHARNVMLEADLELHFTPNGYVGLCGVENGVVNVCGLFRSRVGERVTEVRNRLRGEPGSLLQQQLARAEFLQDSFCAVGGLAWENPFCPCDGRLGGGRWWSECRVGDALAAIPPVTGNGLSLAFESAALASGPLAAWSADRLDWSGVCRAVRAGCRWAFARRLRWAGWFHRALFEPPAANMLRLAVARSELLWHGLFRATRC